MNYSFKYYILLLCVIISSCNKMVEIPPNPIDRVSGERVYSDSVNVLAAMVGIYSNFKMGGSDGSINSRLLTMYAGMSADELKFSSSSISPLYENNLLVDDASVAQLWQTAYTGIYQTNDFLQGVAGAPFISKAFQQQVTGEALLVRALYYFNLVNLFGGVPVITSTDYKTNAVQPRATADSVYALVISDLTKAAGLLTPTYPSAGRARPNVHTANALLAKVYLYRQQWQQAADLSNQVLKSGMYDLVALDKVFLTGSREAIWQLPTLVTYNQTSEANYFVPYSSSALPGYVLIDNLMNAFEAGDQRKNVWVKTNVINGISYPYPYKYRNLSSPAATVEDYMEFRAAEQYLIRSEALAHLNLLDSARSGINQVRARAGLGATTAVSQAEVLSAIEQERRVELFAERGNRWFDLKRTGRADAVLGALKPGWQPTDALYPIPLLQIRNNPFLTQNPGYN